MEINVGVLFATVLVIVAGAFGLAGYRASKDIGSPDDKMILRVATAIAVAVFLFMAYKAFTGGLF